MKSSWRAMRLDQLGLVGRGKSKHRPRNDPKLYGGPHPFIQTADVMGADPYISKHSETYSDAGLEQSKMWPAGTLCITIAGANTAKTAILKFDACFPDSIVGFIPDESLTNIYFVKYALDLMRTRFLAVTRGATQDNLSLDKLLSFPLNVPSPSMQRRIGMVLAGYDDLIENSKRRIEILEEMGRSLYREWFVQCRYPGHLNIARAASVLGEMPVGWKVSTVKELAGLVSRGPTLSYGGEGGVPVLNQRCIRNGEIELQAIRFAAPLEERKSDLYVRINDILINSMGVGTLGRVSRNLSVTDQMIVHNCITIVRAKPGEPTAPFLYYLLSERQEHLERLGVGATGQTSLRSQDIESIQFALPHRRLLERFSQAIEPMWKQIGMLKRQIENLRRTRDIIAPLLICGDIEVGAAPLSGAVAAE